MATLIRVNVRGDKEVVAKLKRMKAKLGKISHTDTHYISFLFSILRYWGNNIYSVFNRRKGAGLKTSGQLGKSLRVSLKEDTGNVTLSMKNLKHSGRWGEGGGYTRDYGRYLRNGSDSSRGKYISWMGGRLVDRKIKVDTEYTRGVSPHYWKEWMSKFKPYVRRKFLNMIDMYIKEVIK